MRYSQSGQQAQRYASIPRIARWIAYMSFVLALLLSLVMTSLFVYIRLYHHAGTIAWSPPETISTATNAVSPPSSWKVLPSLPSPQADNAAVYVQVQGRGYVYMSGGYHGYKYLPHYDHNLYRYDIAAARWQVAATGGSLLGTAACDGHGHVFLVRGADDFSDPTMDFLMLTIR